MSRAVGIGLLILLAGVLIFVLLAGVRRTARWMGAENPLFTLRELQVTTDGRLKPELIRRYAELEALDNIFNFDIDEARKELLRVPLIEEVTIRRELPGRVVIRVVERVPLARMPMPGAGLEMAVDRTGFIIGPSAVGPGLPRLEGVVEPGVHPGGRLATPLVLQALELLDACDRSRLGQSVRIAVVDLTPGDHFLLHLAGGERARLPARDMEAKLRDLAQMLRASAVLPRRPGEVPEFDLLSDRIAGTARGFVVAGAEGETSGAPARRRAGGGQ